MTTETDNPPVYMRWYFPAMIGGLCAALLWYVVYDDCIGCVSFPSAEHLIEIERGQSLRRELSALRGQALGARLACPPADRLSERPVSPPLVAPNLAEMSPKDEAPPADPPVVEPVPVPEPPPQSKRGDNLVVPDQAWRNKSLDFLAGCWDSISNIHDVRTGKPLKMTYCFDKNGAGKITIDSVSRGICQAVITARIADNSLQIKSNDAIPCRSGGGYLPITVVCSGKADMNGRCHVSHGNEYDAVFKKKS